MKEITFKAPPDIATDLTDSVAVEIMDRRLTRKGSTTLSKPVKLDFGKYIAQATLPDGQVLSTSFEVKEGGASVARLLPDQDASDSTYENQAMAAGASPESVRAGISTSPTAASAREASGHVSMRGIKTAAPAGSYRILAGNMLSGGRHSVQDGWLPTAEGAAIPVTGGDTPGTLQLQCGDARQVNIMLPLNPGEPGTVTWYWQGGRVLLDVAFANPDVTILLGHAAAGRIAEAARSISEGTPLAKKQLRDDPEHPICAVICAYILLRTNQIQRVEGWLRHLADRCEWLPDGLLVLTEQLARLGKHDEAFHVLLKLSERGLPLFSSGLSYAVDRLSYYKTVAGSPDQSKAQSVYMKAPLAWGDKAEDLLERLRRVASHTDFDRTILTYEGP